MDTAEAAIYLNIPHDILVRMRSRETVSLLSGPPVSKKMGKNGETIWRYMKREVTKWRKTRACLITAKDAAIILGLSREDLLGVYGLTGYDISTKEYKGRLIVDNGHAIYVWRPSGQRGSNR